MPKRISNPNAQVALKDFISRENNYIHFEYEDEMKQYEMMKNGDPGAADESHKMMAENTSTLADDPVTNMKYLMICNATLMTRFAIEGGLNSETAYNTSDLYIYNMNKCTTVQEVLDLHYEMVTFFTEQMQKLKKQNVYSRQVILCMDYIDHHLHESIRLDDLAAFVKLNNNYFSTLFKKETGYTVSEYILSRKLEVAENMLRFSDYSCAEISSFLAFNSQSYFTQCFREKNSCTPAAFRKAHFNKHIKGRHK